jgi:hypothetical protein
MTHLHLLPASLVLGTCASLHAAECKSVRTKWADYDQPQLQQIQNALSELPPEAYRVQIVQNGVTTANLGSGNMAALQTLQVFSPDAGELAGSLILTTISNHIKEVWTTDLTSPALRADILEVERLLNLGVQNPVDVRAERAVYSPAQIQDIRTKLAALPENFYRATIVENGVSTPLGSANLRDLRAVEVYSPEGAAGIDTIVTTISNYVREILTSNYVGNPPLQQQVAQIEAALNAGVNPLPNPAGLPISVEKANYSPAQLGKIKTLLGSLPPQSYQMIIFENGRSTALGSASMSGLQALEVYSPDASADFGNTIITTISNYVKEVWTTDFVAGTPMANTVQQIEAILAEGVREYPSGPGGIPVSVNPAQYSSEQMVEIQSALADLPQEAYRAVWVENGKPTVLGSGAMAGLQAVEIYSPDAGSLSSSTIVTTISNYIKEIWTSNITQPDLVAKVARVEAALEAGRQFNRAELAGLRSQTIFERNPETGNFDLTLKYQESTDLLNYEPLDVTDMISVDDEGNVLLEYRPRRAPTADRKFLQVETK